MMTKARLIKHLFDYRATCARIEMLTLRVKKGERWLERHTRDEFIEGAQLAGRTITDMPIAHGGVSSPTEKVAIRLMDEDLASFNVVDFERDTQELETLKGEKQLMDILIGSLQDRERFVITTHLIDGLRWRETGKRYAAEYGVEMTEGALQYIMRQGLDRMLNVARAGE